MNICIIAASHHKSSPLTNFCETSWTSHLTVQFLTFGRVYGSLNRWLTWTTTKWFMVGPALDKLSTRLIGLLNHQQCPPWIISNGHYWFHSTLVYQWLFSTSIPRSHTTPSQATSQRVVTPQEMSLGFRNHVAVITVCDCTTNVRVHWTIPSIAVLPTVDVYKYNIISFLMHQS